MIGVHDNENSSEHYNIYEGTTPPREECVL